MENEINNPIFVCGFPKSGTTLLSQLFCNVPNIHIDFELHVAVACLQMAQETIVSGEMKTDLKDHLAFRLADLAKDDFRLYYDLVKDLFRRLHTGYQFGWRWGNNCKSIIEFIPTLKRFYPESVVIHMIRDPRDVWASIKHSYWPGQEYFTDFKFFKKRYREMYEKSKTVDVKTLLYGDLIADPQKAFDLIGETYLPRYISGTGRIFQYRTLPYRLHEIFQDGISDVHHHRYKKELASDEINLIEQAFPDIFEEYDFS